MRLMTICMVCLKTPGHPGAQVYTKERLRAHEKVMKICDGLIVSTQFLKEKYSVFNDRVYLCTNAVESKRYGLLKPPERNHVNIGWGWRYWA